MCILDKKNEKLDSFVLLLFWQNKKFWINLELVLWYYTGKFWQNKKFWNYLEFIHKWSHCLASQEYSLIYLEQWKKILDFLYNQCTIVWSYGETSHILLHIKMWSQLQSLKLKKISTGHSVQWLRHSYWPKQETTGPKLCWKSVRPTFCLCTRGSECILWGAL